MSIRRLPRQMGIWVVCDGSDKENCQEKRFTANIYAKVNRAAAALEGWGRGLRKDRKRRDQCPKHLALERKLFEEAKAKREQQKKERDERRKAAFAEKKAAKDARPKKPRKQKPSSAVTSGAVTAAEEASIGQPPSPSAA